MSDDDVPRNGFEEALRAIAQEVGRAVERLSEIDLDEIARMTGADADRAKQWVEDAGEWLRAQTDSPGGEDAAAGAGAGAGAGTGAGTGRGAPATPAGDDALRGAGPHPLDVPTAEQGLALAALESGRWTLEPGTSALAVQGGGPGPSDALGLVRELRARDWIRADGGITVVGRRALNRWLDAADQG